VALKVLSKVDDIGFATMTGEDVVRHPLVQKIVKAYDEYESKKARFEQAKPAPAKSVPTKAENKTEIKVEAKPEIKTEAAAKSAKSFGKSKNQGNNRYYSIIRKK